MVHCTVVAWNHNRVTASAHLGFLAAEKLVREHLETLYDYAIVSAPVGPNGTELEMHYKAYNNAKGVRCIAAGVSQADVDDMILDISRWETDNQMSYPDFSSEFVYH